MLVKSSSEVYNEKIKSQHHCLKISQINEYSTLNKSFIKDIH